MKSVLHTSSKRLLFRLRNGVDTYLLQTRRWKSNKEDIENVLRCRKDTKLHVCVVEDGTVHPCEEPPRVVIIGAGMAGLSAANRLLQCGLDNFVILEASDRPGGRIHSCYMGNVICELGADKILGGTPMNPVFSLAAREGLVDQSAADRGRPQHLCLLSDGQPVSRLVQHTAGFSMSLIHKQAAALFGKQVAEGKSLWDFVSQRIFQEVALYPEKYRVMAARMMFGMTNDRRSHLGADLTKVSLHQFGKSYASLGSVVRIPTGCVGVLAPLLRTMPTCDHIRYCKSVEKIAWSDKLSEKSDRVKVFCCDGTVYPADYVIITLPLGVLKEKASTMFIPALPDEKMNAIKKIGYGNVCKLTLEYEKPFWVWKSGGMLFGWSMSELLSRKSCPDWVKGIGSIDETEGTQQALNVLIGDEEADVVEKLGDVKLAEDFTRILRRFTGDPTLPYPVNVLKSAWKSSPLFRGSRPYLAIGSTVGHQCELAQPVPEEEKGVPALLFAGDATVSAAIGTMHGARISGLREADRVLSLTRKAAGRPKPGDLESPICKTEEIVVQKMVANN